MPRLHCRGFSLVLISGLTTAYLLLVVCTAYSSLGPTPQVSEDAFAMNRRLARTINFGQSLEAPHEGDWGLILRAPYFRVARDAGFTAVRVPIRWSAHAAASPPYTVDREFFARIDWVVDRALANSLAAVIDVHHYDELTSNPASHKERFIAIWKQIAEHYKCLSR